MTIHSDQLYRQGVIEGGPVLYNPTPGGDQPEPALRRFAYGEHVRTARQTQRDYSFTHPQYDQEHSRLAHTGPDYERYDYPGRYKHDDAGAPFTLNRLRGLRRDACLAEVTGDDARLLPGLAFDLTGHPRPDWNRGWRPVRMRHHGVHYASQAEDSADAERGTHYLYTAELVPDTVEWRPAPVLRPLIHGPQVATVVGPPGEEIYCDKWGRVKVQFPWDRQGRHNEHSSCWLRVAQHWAGVRWGHQAIPRIGQEVIVAYLDGDADQPIIIGRSYRATNPPPYALPRHNILSGIKSREHKGGRENELRLDDTTQEISAALLSDHGASALTLGYLTHPRPDGGAARGEGFELRTDAHGALRAAKGLLLTTEPQPEACAGHLERSQLVSVLEAALELARQLGDYASEHQGLAHDAAPRQHVTEAVRDLGHGANDQPDSPGDGSQPVLGLSAPAGIAVGTPRSLALGAGEQLDGVAQRHVQFTAGEQLLLHAGQGISAFAQSGDMRHIAHQGELLLQAQKQNIRIEADQSVEISASQQHVLVAAQKQIILLCGGAYIKMADGNIELGMPGDFIVKAANHRLEGPSSASAHFNSWETAPFDDIYAVYDEVSQEPLANVRVEMTRGDGTVTQLTTDAQGRLPMQQDLRMDRVTMRILSSPKATTGNKDSAT